MTTDQTRHCTVCNDPSLYQAHGLFYPVQTTGRWDTKPLTTELGCRVETDGPAAFVYRMVIRLAERQGLSVSELMDGGET
jgi:hypothetical protein